MKSPGTIDNNLYMAQMARRITDRIVGYKISPVMWKKGMANTSAGRVQSVALKLITQREHEIESFKPEEYWTLSANFKNVKEKKIFSNLKILKGKKMEKFS